MFNLIKKILFVFLCAAISLSLGEIQAAEEPSSIDAGELNKVIQDNVKKAIEDISLKEKADRRKKEEELRYKLEIVVKDWIDKRSNQHKSQIGKIIEQEWQHLLSTPPQHLDYYLRDFSLSVKAKNLSKSESVTYPYEAYVNIREILYVEQSPLLAEPRVDYQFTAELDNRMVLKYSEISGWQIGDYERLSIVFSKGWPAAVTNKVGTYFIASD
ncbi:hypothetical protein ACFL0T_07425 [Candidatus Omnitrophota bacterium]